MQSYDLLIVGSGPAGMQAAIRARQAGRRVAVIEKRTLVGGSCIHSGTIPSKTLRQAVIDLSGFRQWGLYSRGPTRRPRLPLGDLRDRFQRVISQEVKFQDRLLEGRQIHAIYGEARFLDPHTFRVAGPTGTEDVRGDNILLAVGSKPYHPENTPFDGKHVLDSDQLLNLKELPRSLTVVGGGVIGCEYAAIFSLVDCDVTLVNRASHLMPFVDTAIIEELETALVERNVTLRLDSFVETIEERNGGVVTAFASGDPVETEALLFCAGRTGSVAGLGLEAAGLETNKYGCLSVDEDFRTAVPHIFAAGDVIGFPSLASVSREQGRVAACRALDVPCRPVASLLPFGIWTVPEIAMVGPTEADAREKGIDVEVGLARYADTARGQIIGDTGGMLKLVVNKADRKLLGAHMIGTGAAELIHFAQLAIQFDSTYLTFVRQVMNYPTLSRVFKVAAWDLLEKLGD